MVSLFFSLLQPLSSITWTPHNPKEGQNVTLVPGGDLKSVIKCSWYRGKRNQILTYQLLPLSEHRYGLAYTGRETINPDCSLHIVNLTHLDTGFYTIQKQKNGTEPAEMGKTFLLVGGKWVPQALEQAMACQGGLVPASKPACVKWSLFT
uniref:Immunoglobulin V-set domain-containing protein n=1 Tax=Varanus komodoensis TaxID=61221 RepID=A0A8D2JHV6_VARKO